MKKEDNTKYVIAIAGTGYVGLSLAVLLAQHNTVNAVDIVPEKVEKINKKISPIRDEYIEKYLAEKELDLTATPEGEKAYREADFVIIAAPTNYDPKENFFDCSAVEAVIEAVMEAAADKEEKPVIVIKSTVPVGYTESMPTDEELDKARKDLSSGFHVNDDVKSDIWSNLDFLRRK